MKKSVRKNHIVINIIPCILMMFIIFMFSATAGQESGNASKGMADYFLGFFPFGQSDIDVRESLLEVFNRVIRKTGHILEFLILTLTYINFLKHFKWKKSYQYLGAYGLCVIYAALDEIHQKYVPGRWSSASDVLIDSIGGAIGVFVYICFINIRKRMEKKDAL